MDTHDGDAMDTVLLSVNEFLDLARTGLTEGRQFIVSHGQEKNAGVGRDRAQVHPVTGSLVLGVAVFTHGIDARWIDAMQRGCRVPRCLEFVDDPRQCECWLVVRKRSGSAEQQPQGPFNDIVDPASNDRERPVSCFC